MVQNDSRLTLGRTPVDWSEYATQWASRCLCPISDKLRGEIEVVAAGVISRTQEGEVTVARIVDSLWTEVVAGVARIDSEAAGECLRGGARGRKRGICKWFDGGAASVVLQIALEPGNAPSATVAPATALFFGMCAWMTAFNKPPLRMPPR